MGELNKIQDDIIEEFNFFSDWVERYEYIIDLGKNLPLIDEKFKTPEYLIKGCQSQVWLNADIQRDGKILFTADSDAVITKGIIALLIRVMSNQHAQEIVNADLYFIDRIGLKEHLSPTRANGLVSMVKQMKFFGIAAMAKKSV